MRRTGPSRAATIAASRRRAGIVREMRPAAGAPGDLLLFRWRPHLPAKHAGILVAAGASCTPMRAVARDGLGAGAAMAAAHRRRLHLSRLKLRRSPAAEPRHGRHPALQAGGAGLARSSPAPLGAVIGRAAGALAGNMLDRALISGRDASGARLRRAAVTAGRGRGAAAGSTARRGSAAR